MNHTQPVLLQGMEIRPEFVLLDIDTDSSAGAIGMLANRLLEEKMVNPGFLPAILKREEDYCTGLAFPEMGIAIPHTDPEHVVKPCIAIGVLRRPVVFGSMGTPDTPCEVEMVFMLGINQPETQLDFLKTLMTTFQTPGRLPALKSAATPGELVEIFKSFFTIQ